MIGLLILRNIIRNKKNSLVIVALIAVISFLFFIGNSILRRSDQGLRETYIECLTGDIVLQKKADVTMNLFTANTPVIDSFFSIPPLPAYNAVLEIVAAETGVKTFTSQVSGSAVIDFYEVREIAPLCGINPETYFTLFEGIIPDAGRLLKPGEFGAMITKERAERIELKTGVYPAIGAPMLLTTGSALGFKIREVPLVGIYHYKNPGPFMNEVVIIDPQTVRALQSIQVASTEMDFDAGDDVFGLLDIEMDSLFDADEEKYAVTENVFSVENLESFLKSFETEEPESLAGGDWNFIILRVNKGVSSASVIDSLNKKLAPYGVLAVGWRIAAGQSAILLLFMQAFFNGGIFIVSVAGIIAAVNILLISLFKRTREIGTLRAIGSGDIFIRLLVMGENTVLAIIAGALALGCGYIAIKILNTVGLVIPNTLVASLLGGEILQLSFIPAVAAYSFGAALFLGIAASVFPVEMAIRIEPVVAVNRG